MSSFNTPAALNLEPSASLRYSSDTLRTIHKLSTVDIVNVETSTPVSTNDGTGTVTQSRPAGIASTERLRVGPGIVFYIFIIIVTTTTTST